MNTDLVIVKYLKAVPPYNVGEIAGKSSEEAEKLVKGGFAEKVNDGKPKQAKAEK
ncbi:MAG: hypothetical protein H9535_19660 [Ignavibacteria bacterium]|nr:hypothetical protein [Ignavibacteria bacterium]MBL7992828.1 hypothetical protein [Candidatus Kapabacteria bacterium]